MSQSVAGFPCHFMSSPHVYIFSEDHNGNKSIDFLYFPRYSFNVYYVCMYVIYIALMYFMSYIF